MPPFIRHLPCMFLLFLCMSSCFLPVGPGWETPAAPVLKASEGDHPDRIEVSWTAWPGASAYQVYVCDTESGLYSALPSGPTSATAIEFTDYLPYMRWYFTVAAIGASGEGERSLPAAGWVRPTNLGTDAVWDSSSQRLTLSWDAVPGIETYRLYYSYRSTGVFYSATGSVVDPAADSEGFLTFPDASGRLTAVIGRSRQTAAYFKVFAYARDADGTLMTSLASNAYLDPEIGGP